MVSLWFLVTFVFQDSGAHNQKTSNSRIDTTGSMRMHVNYSIEDAYRKCANLFIGSEGVRRSSRRVPGGSGQRVSLGVALIFGEFFDSLRSLRMTGR